MADVDAAKAALRETMLRRRAELPAERTAAAGAAICARVLGLPEWRQAGTVLLYAPIVHEVDCRPLIHAGLAARKRVALPRVRSRDDGSGVLRPVRPRGMDGVAITRFPDDLRPGVLRILEPAGDDVVDPSGIDLVVAPGLAFDGACRRLGYGGGFYDRYLSGLRERTLVLGVCFDVQRVAEVPVGPLDRRVHAVITEAGIWRCPRPR